MQLSKFIKDNKLPRYVLFGIIMIKTFSIYDKMQQLVAINQMSSSIVKQQSHTLRQHFETEEELQDLLTKRMLESSMVNDDDEDLGPEKAQKLETSGIMSHGAKAKTRNFK